MTTDAQIEIMQKERYELDVKVAKQYINHGIKEGFFEAEQFEGMTDDELLSFINIAEMEAEYALDRGRE